MTIKVALGHRSYAIHVGRGLLVEVDRLIAPSAHARTAVIVTQANLVSGPVALVEAGLRRLGLDVVICVVADGETAKSNAGLAALWAQFAEVPLGRHDLVVAVGGGVVGDLAGFAAATWNRGIDVVQVPTTLLAQVDSSIGGKTGINLAAGKNLVGAFHQPTAVVADVEVLATLPKREIVAGLGEIVKYAYIADLEILRLLEADPDAAIAGDPDLLEELVRRSAAVKADVVSGDERESGRRAHLNFGHTFGHAVEALTGYTEVLHGEAVAIGIAMALRLGVAMGVTQEAFVARHDEVCGRLGLPTRARAFDRDDLWATLARDKKAADGVRWVLMGRGGEVIVQHVPDVEVDRAIAAVTRPTS